ncbi:transcriptional regulator, TetR family [Chitinophaga costaii]|uniref:Transcriptional regulator, TetR family n=1 Tax=Chitinophaga costaii TaxID=1335309 RepID=A0A1C4BIA7_9BACT|nr:TetR/AcrR family transcriptional regulator [Chitinophaga costaii]SCC06691.1 transcriptional regulator, TetR family [Chitinophaga costaii]
MKSTKQKIIDLADELIRTRGYNAFSYADIAAQLHIKNAAIHYHFPIKADLGISVLEHEMAAMRAAWQQWAALPEDEQLQKFMHTFGIKSKEAKICLMGSLTPDYITFTAAMQEKVEQMCAEIIQWLTQVLQRGREKKRVMYEGRPYDRALLVIASLQSSLLLSRVMGAQAFGQISQQLLQDLRP